MSSESPLPRHVQSQPLELYLSELHRMDSPQLLSHLSRAHRQDTHSPSFLSNEINLEQLLACNHGPSVRRVCDTREKYREIKQKIVNSMSTLRNQKSLQLAEVVQWKQTILSTYLNQVLVEMGKECREKSEILVFIWNTAFNIIDYLFETVTRMGDREEKKYLQSLLTNHSSYQGLLDNLNAKLNKKENERKRQEEFIKVLVYNLRYKRKEIKKLAKNLKLCTVKLNQFKDFYLDLQLEHIELLSENRDISKENALNLLKRKQEINHEKRKEYKLKQSHKRIRFQIENQIDNQNKNEGENVDKLNDELQAAFNKYYFDGKETKSMQNLQNVAQNIFQNALDDFNVRIDDIPETETIIDFKNNIAFMDAATDMADFQGDTEEKEVQMSFNDRLMEDMILHAAVQTVEVKPKAKVYEQCGAQAMQVELRSLKLNRVRVLDRSYLLEDYREKDRRVKLERNPTLKTKTEQYLKSMREIHYYDNNKKTVELLDYELDTDQNHHSAETQTEDATFINFATIPTKMRNTQFEREVHRYLERAKRLSINVDEENEEMSRTAPSLRTRPALKKTQRKNHLSDTFQDSQDLRNNSLPGSFYTTDRSKQSTARVNFHTKSRASRDSALRRRPKDSQHIWEIKESRMEDLHSRQQEDGGTGGKFWVGRKDQEEVSRDKLRFLNDLNLSDKLLNGFSQRFQLSGENRKLLVELQKLSEELSSNRNLVQLLESNIAGNMHILQEELRKMLQRKRTQRRLPLSRQRSLTRIISLVYTYAYHLYFNHQKPLLSLILPLFHYFKIGYGEIKKNDLYLRMLYFLSQTVSHQQEYYIFDTFILFLGLDLDGSRFAVGRHNTCLFLRLLSVLSVNFRFPLNVEQLYTTMGLLDSKCREILQEEHYEAAVIEKVVERVKVKLQSLINDGEPENYPAADAADYGEIKINVFKCCQFIIEELEKIKTVVYDSYTHLYDYFRGSPTNPNTTPIPNPNNTPIPSSNELTKHMFHHYIVRNLYVPNHDKRAKLKALATALAEQQADAEAEEREDRQVGRAGRQGHLYRVVGVFLQLNIIDFNKIYFMALAKYRIKEEFLYLSINRRYAFLIKYLELHPQHFALERALLAHLTRDEKNLAKEMVNKKVMGLAYLQVVEYETDRLLQDLLGSHLSDLYALDF